MWLKDTYSDFPSLLAKELHVVCMETPIKVVFSYWVMDSFKNSFIGISKSSTKLGYS
jgi:hypothetical protein